MAFVFEEEQSAAASPSRFVFEEEAPEDVGFIRNALRGAGERASSLVGEFIEAGAALQEKSEFSPVMPSLSGVGSRPQYVSPEDRKAQREEANQRADKMRSVDLGYDENRNTIDGAKGKYEKGDYLGAAYELWSAGNEMMITSLPDMAGSAVLPLNAAYLQARSGEIAQANAKNQGKERADDKDIAQATPFALASTLLERILPGRIFRGAGEISEEAAKEISDQAIKHVLKKTASEAGQSALIEGGTEFIQEGVIEYVGQRYGTDAAMDLQEALALGTEAMVLGSIGGSTVGGAKGAYEGVSDVRQAGQMNQSADQMAEAQPEQQVQPEPIMEQPADPQTEAPTLQPEQIAEPEPIIEPPADAQSEVAAPVEPIVAPQPEAIIEPVKPALLDQTPDDIESEILTGDPDIDAELAEMYREFDIVRNDAKELARIIDDAPQAPAPERFVFEETAPTDLPVVPEQQNAPEQFDEPAIEPKQPIEPVQPLIEEIPQAIATAEPVAEQALEQISAPEPEADLATKIDLAASEAATSPLNDLPEPTEAMKEAGNYRKGKIRVQGLDISIENPRGSTRSGVDPDGKPWSNKMHSHYGYIRKTEASDGDAVDVFIGPNPESKKVFVVDQVNADGTYDESKVLVGFDSKLKARSGYKSNYSNGWKVGPITSMTMDEFKAWVKSGDTKKPLQPDHFRDAGKMVEPEKPALKAPITESKQPEPASKQPKTELAAPIREIAPAKPKSELPAILTETKAQTLKKMAAEQGIKKGSPGYADAMARLADEYETEVDRAQAALPFEQFNELNSDTPESINRQAYDALREEFELAENSIRFSLGADTSSDNNVVGAGKAGDRTPVSQVEADAVIVRILSRINRRNTAVRGAQRLKQIVAVDSFADFPAVVKKTAERQGYDGKKVEGVFHDNSIYVNRSALSSKAAVERVIFHELYGHYGLRQLFDTTTMQAMGGLYLGIGGSKGVADISKRHGIDLRHYARGMAEEVKSGTRSRESMQAIMAEELLAHIAQDSRPGVKRRLLELVGQLRAWLRRHGFAELSQLGDTDIYYLLKQARDAVHDGEGKLSAGTLMAVAGPLFSIKADANIKKDNFSSPDDSQADSRVNQGVDYVLRKMADKMRPLLNTQREIQKATGTAISEDVNAYLAEELFHGKTENDLRKMEERYIEPMIEKMAKYQMERAELDMYLWAVHAPERNKQIAKINPDMPDGGSGMRTAQALEVLKKAKAEGRLTQLAEVSQYVYGMLKQRREIMKGSLQEDGMIDAWDEVYKYYVPLKGRASDESGGKFPRVGKGFDIRGKETLRALGRRTKPESPVLHAIRDTTETIIRYRKNEVGNTFLAMVEKYPNPGYWNVYTSDSPELEPRLLKSGGKEVVGEARVIDKNKYFITKKNGKEYYIDLKDEKLLRAMKNMGPEPMNWFVQYMGRITRFLSAMNTSYNPEFTVTNFTRDIQAAVINILAEQDLHDGKAKDSKLAARMVKGVPMAARAIYASLHNKKLDGDAAEWQKVFDQFRDDGAKTGWFDMKDIDGQARQLEDLINMRKKSMKGKLLRTKKAIGDFVETANSTIENAVRLSAYKAALEAGISRKQAASLAKNLTVNFNRKGEIGQTMNSLYMFANASIQGTAVFARAIGTLKVNPGGKKSLNLAQKVGIGIAASAYGLALLNREMAGKDDDDENWYDKVPDYEKERNIVIMKSILGGEPGEYWKIPLPYGYNIFNVIGNSAEAIIAGSKGVGEASADIAKAFFGSFSPLGIAESDSVLQSAGRTLTPTVGKPFVDISMNENFFGSPIFRENFEFGLPKPESHLSMRSTNEIWKWTSEFLNDVSGGSEYRSGWLDISPDKFDYVFDAFTGSSGAFYSKIASSSVKAMQGRELEDREIPFYRKVSGKVAWYQDQTKFYDRFDEVAQLQEEYINIEDADAAEKFYKKHGDKIELVEFSKAVKKQLSALRKERDVIEGDDSLSEKEKDEQLKALEQIMKAGVDAFNAEYPN